MATTWNDLINEALADLGVIRPGEVVSTTVQSDCFLRLQQMIASLSTEGAVVFTETLQSFSLVAGTQSYTLGTGGTLVTSARAQKVVAWKAVGGAFTSGGTALSFDQFDQAAQAASISFTTAANQVLSSLAAFFIAPTLALSQASVPVILGADTAYPTINVRVFPAPAVNGILELAYWVPLTQPVTVTDPVGNLPPGYESLLHFNLAMQLLPRYGRQGYDSAALAANAQASKNAIIVQNTALTTSEKTAAVGQ